MDSQDAPETGDAGASVLNALLDAGLSVQYLGRDEGGATWRLLLDHTPIEDARQLVDALTRVSVASPTSAIPRALPQDRDAAVGEALALLRERMRLNGYGKCLGCAREEPIENMEGAGDFHIGPDGEHRECERPYLRRIAALARLAPPQRAPAEPTGYDKAITLWDDDSVLELILENDGTEASAQERGKRLRAVLYDRHGLVASVEKINAAKRSARARASSAPSSSPAPPRAPEE